MSDILSIPGKNIDGTRFITLKLTWPYISLFLTVVELCLNLLKAEPAMNWMSYSTSGQAGTPSALFIYRHVQIRGTFKEPTVLV